MGAAPLVCVIAPAAAAVEAWWRAAEGAAATGEARGRAAAGRVRAVVGGGCVGARRLLVVVMVVVQAQDVAVVGGAAGGMAEDGVRLGEQGECGGGVCVGGVGVRVVRLGEGVKGSAVPRPMSAWHFHPSHESSSGPRKRGCRGGTQGPGRRRRKVGLLDLGRGRVARHPQPFVVVLCCDVFAFSRATWRGVEQGATVAHATASAGPEADARARRGRHSRPRGQTAEEEHGLTASFPFSSSSSSSLLLLLVLLLWGRSRTRRSSRRAAVAIAGGEREELAEDVEMGAVGRVLT